MPSSKAKRRGKWQAFGGPISLATSPAARSSGGRSLNVRTSSPLARRSTLAARPMPRGGADRPSGTSRKGVRRALLRGRTRRWRASPLDSFGDSLESRRVKVRGIGGGDRYVSEDPQGAKGEAMGKIEDRSRLL